MVRFDKILVPLDSTELAERALDVALTVAGKFDSEVILLSVRKDAAALEGDQATADLASIEGEVAALLGMARRKLADHPNISMDRVRAEVRAGRPTAAIVQACNDVFADLVVMGTHGRQGLSDIFVGSTTERVSASVSASVLAVKPEGFPYLRE